MITLARLASLLRFIDATITTTIITATLLMIVRLKKVYFNTIKIDKLKILNFDDYYSRESINSQSEDYSTDYHCD